MTNKLKPCPFCGNKLKFKNRFIEESKWIKRVFIFCSCGISLYGGLCTKDNPLMKSVVEDELIRKWNIRVGDCDE